MLDRMMSSFDFHAAALQLRGQRQQLIASNIANADTPNYKARDLRFTEAMAQYKEAGLAAGSDKLALRMSATAAGHVGKGADGNNAAAAMAGARTGEPGYRAAEQASIDGNSVDLDRERANFLDNSLRYETTLKFMNSSIRQMITAIKGE